MYVVVVLIKLLLVAVFCQWRTNSECESYQAKLFFVTDTNAKCIDGSSPAFYFKNGSGSGINKWFVFFEGGGWCYTLEDCLSRSKGRLGSSDTYPKCLDNSDMKFYLSSKRSQNPLLYNWNIVLVKYCDASSYAGHSDIYYQGKVLYFRGKYNRDASIHNLMTEQKVGSLIKICKA